MQIKHTIFPSSLGDGWEDVGEAAQALAFVTASNLRAAFPNADVQVTVNNKASGYEPEVEVLADEEQIDAPIQTAAGRVIEVTWSEFCDLGEDSVLHARRQALTTGITFKERHSR